MCFRAKLVGSVCTDHEVEVQYSPWESKVSARIQVAKGYLCHHQCGGDVGMPLSYWRSWMNNFSFTLWKSVWGPISLTSFLITSDELSRASYLLHGNAGGFAGLRCPDSCSACAILTEGGMVQGLVVACYIWIHALVSRCVWNCLCDLWWFMIIVFS